jgi:hypothetical protein
MRMALYLCGLLLQIHNPSFLMKDTSNKLQLRDLLQNIWPAFCKTLKFIKNKESLKTLHSYEKSKEI